ncbi:class I SAM-dependent methyltransferase [Paracoccus sp. CPCC 101403]|uniref:Class I SAM-dependent methyltransferase n=3 Tax=Paracoccus broussonetiae TaxID=3075834 RepID=A0ABU3EI13_9RHOB|nr:class I SAM-dependent methyltransferase [Paracoccus sp. CPCC 101403]
MHSVYYNDKQINKLATDGQHRAIIGGMWEEMGELQLDILQKHGLKPEHKLLDIGCGSLRLGTKAVPYLNPGNYWATDLVEALMDAGYQKEIIPLGLQERLPRSNLVQDAEFTFEGVPRRFDYIIAQSVFTHLPLNHLRHCLARLANHLEGSAIFLFTVFEAEPGTAPDGPSKQSRGPITTYPHKDPFHLCEDDLTHIGRGLPWTIDFIREWDHPRNQKLVMAKLRS